jgi:hypothetical protein
MRYRIKTPALLLITAFLLWHKPIAAQAPDSVVSTPEKVKGLIPLPVLYYTPDTRLGFGGALIGFFKLQSKQDSTYTRLSTARIIFDYTLNKQTDQFLEWAIFTREEKYLLRGELRHRVYADRFYGIGNNTPLTDEEKYSFEFVSTKFGAFKKISEFSFLGPDLQLTNFYNVKTNPLTDERPSQLEEKQIAGYKGGLNSGLGIVYLIDSRDNVAYASRGIFLEAAAYHYGKTFGGDFNYENYKVNFSKYFQLKPDHIIGSNTVFNFNTGEVPFMLLAPAGGDKILRGYSKNRFSDQNFAGTQVEYRFPLFWRFSMATFAGIGEVFDDVNDIRMNNLKYSVGTGLRFALNPQQKLNLRADIGYGREGINFYMVIGEAF